MRRSLPLCAFFLALLLTTKSQTLLPSIGIGPVPADNTPICNIPWYLGSFYTSGKQAGDTAADFTLYSINGDTFNLGQTLASGKRVLMIAGSYTCPVFRNKISSINNVLATYSSQVEVVVIYGVEAHPTDTSPYFGYINVTSANQSAGILYPQPTTYAQRKSIASDLLSNTSLNLQAPVYIDGPCNNWWSYYGPAPNNSYLIDTNGVIFSKHGWYDKFPDNIMCDIDSMLGIPTTSCNPLGNNGTFTITVTSNDTVWGPLGATLSTDVNLINNSPQNALIFMRRMINDTASGWATSMCADVCYSTSTDTVTILVAPGDTQSFHFYFYSSSNGPDTSRARMRWRNVNNSNNVFTRDFVGITNSTNSVHYPEWHDPGLIVHPNPAQDHIGLYSKLKISRLDIYDLAGRWIAGSELPAMNIEKLPAGIYSIQARLVNGSVRTGKFVKSGR